MATMYHRTVASVSELTCIYLALILHDDEVTTTALANVNLGSLICNAGAGGPAPSSVATPAEKKKVEAKKEESEKSDNNMGFGLFD
ncbi:PREDICTED: 60S acidic ribosomal protein P1-like [Elephantulus edwardii]|uniref:60S acidic ribosomal protein P1-like n=1 Tax=Elephantulus edwardii TaxID=28737 RepID=UPI0003F092A8|nr:PREDICTED: 60S acidic ribosomal protein P1-like [Elephantulus edwardii]